jgi:hypothetical protein
MAVSALVQPPSFQKNHGSCFNSCWDGVAFQMHVAQFEEIIRDAKVAACISPIVWKHGLSEEETTKVLLELHLRRTANVVRITCSLKRP